jgi:hypothetical protein
LEICRVRDDSWINVLQQQEESSGASGNSHQRLWLPSSLGPGQIARVTAGEGCSSIPVDISLTQEGHATREFALGKRSTNIDLGFAVMSRKIINNNEGGVDGCSDAAIDDWRLELIEMPSRTPQVILMNIFL